MIEYIVRRLLLVPPTLVALSFGVFVLASIAPGDPAVELARRTAPSGEITAVDVARARTELGLDRPFGIRYVSWLAGALHGDLGRSFTRRSPVAAEIAKRAWPTAQLALAALALTCLLALPLGIGAALAHRTWLDHVLRVVSLLGASLPGFFLAYVLIAILATGLHLLPVAGRQGASSLLMPALALCAAPTAGAARLLRAALLETFREDYIRTARAKGLSRPGVVVKHALPNAAIPVVTVLGGVLGHLLAGAVIVEFIFAWPGLGRLTVEAVAERDYPMIEGLVVFAGAVFMIVNLIVDLSYSAFDPRVRLGRSA